MAKVKGTLTISDEDEEFNGMVPLYNNVGAWQEAVRDFLCEPSIVEACVVEEVKESDK